jgi:hypothetical protein
MILPVLYNTLSPDQGIDAGFKKLLNQPIDGGLTVSQALSVLAAILAGKTTITGSTVVFRDIADTKNMVTATMDGSERQNVTLNVL